MKRSIVRCAIKIFEQLPGERHECKSKIRMKFKRKDQISATRQNLRKTTTRPSTSLSFNRTTILALPLGTLLLQLHGERTSLAESLAVEVEHVHRDAQQDADGAQDERGNWQRPLRARLDVGEHWLRVQSRDASQEVTAETVAAGRRGGVWTVCGHHVVDSRHVNGEIGDTDEGRGELRHDPVESRWSERRPAVDEEPNWLEQDEEKEPPIG